MAQHFYLPNLHDAILVDPEDAPVDMAPYVEAPPALPTTSNQAEPTEATPLALPLMPAQQSSMRETVE